MDIPEFDLAVKMLIKYRETYGAPSYGQYGLQLVCSCFTDPDRPVTRQQLVAVGLAAGYTESTVSGAICLAKRHGHLKSVKCHKQPVSYRVKADFINSSFRIYKRASRRSRRAGKFYTSIA